MADGLAFNASRLWLLGVLAVLVPTAGCGGSSSHTSSGSTPIPSSSSSAPTPVCPNTVGGACLGKLGAGTYSTTQFHPRLTYAVPGGGWTNFEDNAQSFTLLPAGVPLGQAHNGVDVILVWQGVLAAAKNCSGSPDVNAATSPKGLAAWFVHRSALDTSRPRPVAIGNLHGYMLSMRVAPHGGMSCGVPLLNFAPNPQDWFGIGSKSDRALVYLLGYNGGTLGVIADSAGPNPPSLAADANVIQHFHFG